ncbi:MAG: ATP-binding protein [Gammaproteobacteria bacterium]|jgi:predicted AAA+ superfamily ATPase
MFKDVYYQYNPWWEDGYKQDNIFPRPKLQGDCIQELNNKAITMLTGLRRTGKTTQLKEILWYLLQQGVPAKHLFYVSLDDYQLKNKSILEIISDYRKLHKLEFKQKVYLFLDEITYKKDFQHQLKNIYDQHNVKIFVSSSSCSALKDKRGYLTGRKNIIEVCPLNFTEYLIFKEIKVEKRDQSLLENYFEEYMQTGGMPEYVLNENREYLVELVDDIIYKDIVAFHGLKRPELVKDYFALLMERSGKQISLNKIAKILGMSPDTASRYLEMFVDAYLVYLVPRHGKMNETILSSKKVYAADLGIRNIFTGFRDKGAIFENVVFFRIKNLEPRYIYQDGLEIDFITRGKTLIEVKYNREINDKQKQLFDTISARKKILIRNFEDLRQLEEIS